MPSPDITGACLCGAVRFSGRPEGEVTRCHCEQCRRWAGDAWTSVRITAPVVSGVALRWFRSSPGAERGFCTECGSSLFWREVGAATMAAALGCVDAPTGHRLNRHTFTGYKGDYYDIADGLPQSLWE